MSGWVSDPPPPLQGPLGCPPQPLRKPLPCTRRECPPGTSLLLIPFLFDPEPAMPILELRVKLEGAKQGLPSPHPLLCSLAQPLWPHNVTQW